MTGGAKEYALALFSLAGERGREDAFSASLALAQGVYAATPELTAFLSSPGIPKAARIQALRDAFDGEAEEDILSLLCLLCEHGCPGLLPDIAAEYDLLLRQSRRVYHAEVLSAAPLTEEERERLLAALEKRFHGRVEAAYRTDASLIGGVRVEVDGTVLDASIRRRLTRLKEGITE